MDEAAPLICGQCRSPNSPAKQICDHCGASLAQGELGIPKTVIRESPPSPAPSGHSLPLAGHVRQSYTPAPQTSPPETSASSRTKPPSTGASGRRIRALLALLALGGAGIGAYLWQKQAARPEVLLPRLAEKYLTTLSRRDYAQAYSLFSPAARTNCTLDELRLLSEAAPGSWSGMGLAKLESDAAVIQYDLTAPGKEPEKNSLFFVLEDGRWVIPYNENLYKKIEQALGRRDSETALLLAQSAARINPRDPVARGQLCAAVAARKVPQDTERECALAVKLSEAYPSKISPESLYHLHALLGDSYNALRRYPESVDQYSLLLASPGLAPERQCNLLLARADTYAAMMKGSEADADLERAAGICTKPADLDYILQRRSALRAK